jgi:DNA-binding transcriptional MerR regulator
MTIKEVAALYRVHPSTVWRWDREGYLPPPAKDFGSRRWVREEVIEALRSATNIRRKE